MSAEYTFMQIVMENLPDNVRTAIQNGETGRLPKEVRNVYERQIVTIKRIETGIEMVQEQKNNSQKQSV